MAGIEEEIKELIGRDDTNAVGVYSALRLITVEDNGEDGTTPTIEADSGTIHVINEVKGDDGADVNLPDPPKAPSSLITVKLGDGVTDSVSLNTDNASIFGIETFPSGTGAGNSLVELVSDGENYHVINKIDNTA
jgi:hypothetical protein